MNAIPDNSAVQQIAKRVLAELANSIGPSSTEQSIAAAAVARLSQYAVRQTWYHDCMALVLLGSRSCLSVSGRDDSPGVEPVGHTNLVTIDLSPLSDGHWGDCARSYVVEEGRVVGKPKIPEFHRGMEFLSRLHAESGASSTKRFTTSGHAVYLSRYRISKAQKKRLPERCWGPRGAKDFQVFSGSDWAVFSADQIRVGA